MNCKPGDLAIMVSADPAWSCLIGSIVEVVGPGIFVNEWQIRFAGSVPIEARRFSHFYALDAALRPVSGLVDIEQKQNTESI